ncbi:MAG: transposase family protein [Chlorobiaceae bacterium]
MQKLTGHYQQLLGLPDTWNVDDGNLSLSGLKIEVHLSFLSDNVLCPQCSNSSKVYDQPPEERWRHLDTMQFETIINYNNQTQPSTDYIWCQ